MPDRSVSKRIFNLAESLRESVFKANQESCVNSLGLLLGGTAAVLLLAGDVFGYFGTAVIFSLGVLIILAAFFALSGFRVSYQFGWGPPIMVVLGYGLGALFYERREWWKSIGKQLRRINEPYEFVLTGLFLVGVMLGVFVVRNWAKEQKAFVDSISGILSGTIVAGILAKLFDNVPGMTQRAFSYYAFGFALSGALNLIAAAWLTARYTNRRSISSRAVLDFMYGPERAELIDKYFLKNFKDDPDYARRWLTTTLDELLRRCKKDFAARIDAARMKRRDSHYYLLTSIKHEPGKDEERTDGDDDDERKYKCVCQRLSNETPIDDKMFRAGVSLRKGDNTLEYIVASGNYPAAFPLLGSVLGLSLEMRQTIVMDRDRDTKFRNSNHKEGISPGEIEQYRGLEEIDYLSYVSIPIISRRREATENNLGAFNIDTKIFVSNEQLGSGKDSFEILRTRTALHDMAKDLYDENDDKNVEYLEEVTKIFRPVLELYAKCSIGTT